METSVRFHGRRTIVAAITVVVTVLFATPAVASDAAVPHPPVPVLQWSDCSEGFQCATAQVPLEYDNPSGLAVSLALIRLPASDHRHRIGSLFANPGGPGGSGVDFVRRLAKVLLTDDVRARFDIVGFDPRGVGASSPLRCFDTFAAALAVVPTIAFPVNATEEESWTASDRALATACKAHGSAIRDHMATADVARDLDLLRQAVGDAGLNYVGYSYGSYIGATYANLFPQRVRALVVDGVLDPVAWATGRGNEARDVPFSTRLQSDVGTYATLRQFFELCKQGGPNCSFSGGDPETRFAALAYRLYFNPIQLSGLRVTYADLIANVLGSMYSPSSWPALADVLQALDHLTSPQSAAAAADALQTLHSNLGALSQEQYPNLVEGFPAVACTDTVNPTTIDRWRTAAAGADAAHPYFGRPWTWLSSICQQWPGADDARYLGPFTHHTRRPVLVVGNRFDPATPFQGAATLASLLPKSRLLTLEGWGHTSLLKSACIDGYVSRYLVTSIPPNGGTTCTPDTIPFAQPLAAARAGGAPSTEGTAAVIPPVIRKAIGAGS
jgi:pimeloyl-ACP methyl ester carboxylesterase